MSSTCRRCTGFWTRPPPRTPLQGSDEQKIGDYYASCMDTAAIDKAGLTPIQPELDRIAAIQSRDD